MMDEGFLKSYFLLSLEVGRRLRKTALREFYNILMLTATSLKKFTVFHVNAFFASLSGDRACCCYDVIKPKVGINLLG